MPIYYVPKEEFKIITYEEIKPYIDFSRDKEMKVLIAMSWLTGARIIELINLRKKDIVISYDNKDLMVVIKAVKHGKIGYPSFSFDDPFISGLIVPYIESIPSQDGKLFRSGKRTYQIKLNSLNRKIHTDNETKWITFHYLRHSRLAFLARILRAFPEEFKSWTGHKSTAFEEYFAPRRIDRFKGKIR